MGKRSPCVRYIPAIADGVHSPIDKFAIIAGNGTCNERIITGSPAKEINPSCIFIRYIVIVTFYLTFIYITYFHIRILRTSTSYKIPLVFSKTPCFGRRLIL